ncbi:MAG: hypothetical protein WCO71_02815 [Pseudomonadota bacterium]
MSTKSTNIWMGVSLVLAFALGVSVSCKQRTTYDSQTKDVAAAGETPILQLLAALNPVGTALAQPGGGGLVTRCEEIDIDRGKIAQWANNNCKNGLFSFDLRDFFPTVCCQSPQ